MFAVSYVDLISSVNIVYLFYICPTYYVRRVGSYGDSQYSIQNKAQL